MTNTIASDFRKSVSFSKDDEVTLFRALAAAIVKNSASTFIDETHGGNVCNVSFTSITGKTEICEIADLLIISEHSSKNGTLRATFWQAKKQAVSKWLNVTSIGSQLDFKGQFNQWDLLSRRPDVSGVSAFHPPTDVLSSFGSPSIGSFGIFYEKGTVTEVAHSIAEFIGCPNPGAKHPTMSVNGYFDKYSVGHSEAIVKQDLNSFLTALLAFEIGAILDSSNASHRWMVQWVRSKISSGSPTTSLRSLDAFLEFDGPLPNDGPQSSGGPSILFVAAGSEV